MNKEDALNFLNSEAEKRAKTRGDVVLPEQAKVDKVKLKRVKIKPHG